MQVLLKSFKIFYPLIIFPLLSPLLFLNSNRQSIGKGFGTSHVRINFNYYLCLSFLSYFIEITIWLFN